MRTSRGFGLLAVLLTTLVALCATGVAQAKSVTKTASAALPSGADVTATVTYTPKAYYDTGTTLTITRAGQKLLTAHPSSQACRKECSVEDIRAVDLQGNGEPVVMLDLYSDGAHCCSITQFYSYDPDTQHYRVYGYDWGDPGYRVRTIESQKVLESADDRFAYAFTDFAASGMPIQLFSFDGKHLVNITPEYPKLISADAARYLKAFHAQKRQRYDDTTGVVAAWAADEDELGRSARVASFLATQAKLGHLNSGIPGVAQNAKYVAKLEAFLKRNGYLSASAAA